MKRKLMLIGSAFGPAALIDPLNYSGIRPELRGELNFDRAFTIARVTDNRLTTQR